MAGDPAPVDEQRERRRSGLTVAAWSHLGPWASRWDTMVECLPLPSPFLRSWWLEAAAGRRPCFLLVFDGDALVGGLALEEERKWGVPLYRMMGAGALCPDHLDLVAVPECLGAVVDALAAWLARPGWRMLDLEGVVAGSYLATALPRSVRREVIDVAPWEALPSEPERYFAERSANFRANLRKAFRRLAVEGAAHRVAPSSSVDAALVALRALHIGQRGPRTRFLTAFDRFAAASRVGVASGEMAFHELMAGDSVVASVAVFDVAGRVSLYQSGHATDHRWRNSVSALLEWIIEDACRRGCAEVDLLRGSEPYKGRFASKERQVLRLLAASGVIGHVVLGASLAEERGRRVAGRVVRRLRVGRRSTG